MLRYLFATFLTTLLIFTSCDQGKRQQMMVASQDVAIRALFAVNPDSTADYMIYWGSDTALHVSRLGVALSNGDTLDSGLELVNFSQYQQSEFWTLPEGAGLQIHDRHAGITINLRRVRDNRPLAIQARIFNGCVAFRYEIPVVDSVFISSPLTGFNAFKEEENDPGIYRSERELWLSRGNARSAPHDNYSRTDWELVYAWHNREKLDKPTVTLNLERELPVQ